jgi:hypothetical protein
MQRPTSLATQPHIHLRQPCALPRLLFTARVMGCRASMHPEALRGHIDTLVLAALVPGWLTVTLS